MIHEIIILNSYKHNIINTLLSSSVWKFKKNKESSPNSYKFIQV